MMKTPKALGKFLAIAVVAASAAMTIGLGRPQDEQIEQLPSVIRSSSSLGEVAFPHQFHFEVLEFECQTCHHETNATALQMPHEDYFKDFWIDCTICHRKDGSAASQPQSCSNCHHDSPTDIADETLSSKVVIHKKCWECHELGEGREASQGCSECHIQDSDKDMFPEMPSIAAMKGQG